MIDGQSFINADDATETYTGTVAFTDINDKTLVPYAHNTITYVSGENGAVTGVQEADFGDEVTLTVTPDTHYELDTLTVKDAAENEMEVTDNTFTMPASNVTVSAPLSKRSLWKGRNRILTKTALTISARTVR